jgi:hypothetical protein
MAALFTRLKRSSTPPVAPYARFTTRPLGQVTEVRREVLLMGEENSS